MNKRILILSHNPFSETNNMGKTLSLLFSEFSSEDVAQIYLRGDTPQTVKFNKFYSISDYDMLKSALGKKSFGVIASPINTSSEMTDEPSKESSIKNLLYKLGSGKSAWINLMRDSIWKERNWKNSSLIEWVDAFSPQVIFYASGESCFSFKIAMNLANHYQIPLVTYFCDDYYFYSKNSISPIYRIYIRKLKKYIENVINHSSELVFISPSMEKTYKDHFGKNGHIIMTPSPELMDTQTEKIQHNKIIMSYLGNVSLRMQSIIDIGQIIYENYSDKIDFNLYTGENKSSNIHKLKSCKGINFMGSVSSKQAGSIMQESDILLHTESFEKNMIQLVKHSISTKIPQILGIGKCMLAYGPKGIASIDYLIDNNCAIVCTNQKDLKEAMNLLCSNALPINEYEKRAMETARKNHDIKSNSLKLREILNGAK